MVAGRGKRRGLIALVALVVLIAGGVGGFRLPRDFVVASLKNRENKITVNFVLEGDVNDPGFSLNEALTTRLASSMAETLGVSLGGVAKGAEGLGQTGM